MKRFTALIFFLLMLQAASKGQPYKTSGGIRAGFPFGLSLKHFISGNNALEFVAGANLRGFVAEAIFENEYRVHSDSRVYWYWGAGLHGGYVDSERNSLIDMKEPYKGAVVGADVGFGFEFCLKRKPLNFAFDLFPSVNLAGYTGWNGINSAVSVRYVF